MNGKHVGYGNEGSFLLLCISFVQGLHKMFISFVSLKGGQGDKETCVERSGNVW